MAEVKELKIVVVRFVPPSVRLEQLYSGIYCVCFALREFDPLPCLPICSVNKSEMA